MRSLGYRTTLHLYAAFVISGAMASLAGVLYVYYNRFINPVAASFQISVEVSLMAIVGGSGTIIGPFLGSGIVLGLRNWVSSFFELHAAVMGLVFIATILWAPHGIVGFVNRWRSARRQGEERAAMTAAVEVENLAQGVRRPARRRRRHAARRARRAARADRTERRRQDHAVPLRHRHAAGVIRPVRLFGHDVTHLPEHRRTKLGMGRTFQITNVFTDLSLAENLALVDHRHRPAQVDLPSVRWLRFPAIREQALAGLDGGRPRRIAPTIRSSFCPTASAASSSWRSRSTPHPRCCFSTSPAPGCRPASGSASST